MTKPCAGQAKDKHWSYSADENYLLVKLKEEKRLSSGEITAHFPGRKPSPLEVHYSTQGIVKLADNRGTMTSHIMKPALGNVYCSFARIDERGSLRILKQR